MQHLDIVRPAPRERPPDLYPQASFHRQALITPDGASTRMVAAMAESLLSTKRPLWEGVGAADRLTPFGGGVVENDAQYYRRRSKEECRAAREAAGPETRVAHQELADRYARLSRRMMRQRGGPPSYPQSAARARIARMLRQRFCAFGGGRALAHASHALLFAQAPLRDGRVQSRSRPLSERAVRSLVTLK